MSVYSRFIRPVLFCFDAEYMHNSAIRFHALIGAMPPIRALISSLCCFSDPMLETYVCGIKFPNPVGLAAGYDKDGLGVQGLYALGFGHIEIGSVSYDFSLGNPKPRLFRLPLDRAVVVNYGLQSQGAEAVAARLRKTERLQPLGINIVKTNRGQNAPPEGAEEIIDDYVHSASILKDLGDYLCLNLSCPNTRDGGDFFGNGRHVVQLLTALSDLDIRCPLFLKVSPLGGVRAIEELLEAVDGFELVSGFDFNLSPGKPDNLITARHVVDAMPGTVSGKPVEAFLNNCIYEMYTRMDRSRYQIIGSGGVFSAEDAYRKIQLGASLVQLLTGLIYEGPLAVKKINQGLCRLLERDGFKHISEAVGSACPNK
jgi:dihydroorotate dehydrogenase